MTLAEMLALALWLGGVALRYASLAIVLLTAGKAVFFDMAGLDDIWRALSFIGVGLAAVGVSYLYSPLRVLRRAAARPSPNSRRAIDTYTPDECKNYFAAAGYDRM